MKMTFAEYIQNPLGKGNPTLNATMREQVRADYTQRFHTLLVRENSNIRYTCYYDKKNNSYYCHFKMPSEKEKKIYYDVVIRFFADADVKEAGQNLEQYYVQFFSNDPAFVYTYANVFLTQDLFVKDLAPRMSKLARKKKPDIKNTLGLVGYVKSIYFAYLFMKERGLFALAMHGNDQPYNKAKLIAEVVAADDILNNYQQESTSRKMKETKPPVKEKHTNNYPISTDHSNIGRTPTVRRTSKLNNVRRTNKIPKRK